MRARKKELERLVKAYEEHILMLNGLVIALALKVAGSKSSFSLPAGAFSRAKSYEVDLETTSKGSVRLKLRKI